MSISSCYRIVRLLTVLLSLSHTVNAASTLGTFLPQHCVKCTGLQYCAIMNNQYLFDPVAGYSRETTTQLEKQGVCEDLDAKTLALSLLGTQQQFKNTSVCRQLVWNFHCLAWVATTFQQEINGTFVTCDDTTKVPLPPCRSLCVEVADQCVYSHFYRVYLDEVCGNIKCLSEIEEAKKSGSTETNIAETTCVSGDWVYAKNKTLSRCSKHHYEPPKAVAAHDASCILVVILTTLIGLFVA